MVKLEKDKMVEFFGSFYIQGPPNIKIAYSIIDALSDSSMMEYIHAVANSPSEARLAMAMWTSGFQTAIAFAEKQFEQAELERISKL